MSREIKIGDRVSWGGKPRTTKDGHRIVPLRIGNCRVLDFVWDNGTLIAALKLPPPMGDDPVGANIDDLELEQD